MISPKVVLLRRFRLKGRERGRGGGKGVSMVKKREKKLCGRSPRVISSPPGVIGVLYLAFFFSTFQLLFYFKK